jgi:uracil-DNA glycosylase
LNHLWPPAQGIFDLPLGDWQPLVDTWRHSAAGQATLAALGARMEAGATIFPAQALRALALTPRAEVKVVVLGQDPYHGPGQAEGLAFSVAPGQRVPPSLRNIFKELQRDLGLAPRTGGSLKAWAERGVLLLNAVLSVEAGRPGSHAGMGWQALTDSICRAVAQSESPSVFMLWGAHAQAAADRVGVGTPHLKLQSNHPSPLSARRGPRPFLGCGHFGAANRFLASCGRGPIDWS